MKKKKVNLSKLFLNKEVIGSLSQEKIVGGATVLEQTCRQSCFGSCLCTQINCLTKGDTCNSCIVTCQPTSPLLCP
ncbi:class I lanthipeptide [Chitinophaga fulva]|uniref:class I lanthipeptide n=1 Tax=Chitinophaga fulva TaxID=2728842 RepID=UPI001980541D